VRYKNRFLQIGPQSNLPPARRKVTVQEHLDGSIHMVYKDRDVLFTEIKELPRKPVVTHQKQKNLNQRVNTSLLRIIPGEDTASNLNASAKHYLYEVTRGHFYRVLTPL